MARRLLLEHAQDVVLAQDEVLLALDLHLAAGILAEQDFVASLHVRSQQLTLLGHLALAHRHDLAFLRLFLGGVRDNDSSLGFFLFLDALDQNAIAQRSDFHGDQQPPCLDVVWVSGNNSRAQKLITNAQLSIGTREARVPIAQCSLAARETQSTSSDQRMTIFDVKSEN